MLVKFIFGILLVSLSFESCYENCQECYEDSKDSENMKCISCKNGFHLLFNTSNCADSNVYLYPHYYLNKTDSILYPCPNNCYKCDPY